MKRRARRPSHGAARASSELARGEALLLQIACRQDEFGDLKTDDGEIRTNHRSMDGEFVKHEGEGGSISSGQGRDLVVGDRIGALLRVAQAIDYDNGPTYRKAAG